MIYRVTNIQEDIDFGCEERAEGTPVMAVVTFEGENGQKMVKKIPDAYVYDEGIEVDSEVVFDTWSYVKKKYKLRMTFSGYFFLLVSTNYFECFLLQFFMIFFLILIRG